MTTKFKINSYYKIHENAIKTLALMDIELRIVNSPSPYVLANYSSPDIVIHPISKLIQGQYPHIKFCGPDCSFPNYEFKTLIGFSPPNEDLGKISHTDTILINTIGDIALIKYAESISEGRELIIHGKQCDSLYYAGPVPKDTYLFYAGANSILVDNEYEVLKALYIKDDTQLLITGFDYNCCFNFRNPKGEISNTKDKLLKERDWKFIFTELLEKIGN